MSEVDHSPPMFSVILSLVSGVAAIAAIPRPTTLAIGGVGVVGLALGGRRGSRRTVSIGGMVLFTAVIVGGIEGESVEGLLLATIGTVLAWDLGQHAIGLGEQIGSDATTRGSELTHAMASAFVGATGASVGYGVYLFSSGGKPIAAIGLLLGGSIALLIALRG